MKHSDAPWAVLVDRRAGAKILSRARVVADVPCDVLRSADLDESATMSDRAVADAYLISAAPDLLNACQAALTAMNGHKSYTEAVLSIRQAIAKAMGFK